MNPGIVGQRRQIGRGPGEWRGEFGVGHEDRDEMRALVAGHHRLGDLRLQGQRALDLGRRDHVAAGILDEIALAVGDAQIAVGVEMADIAGRQPAVADRARGRLGVVPIALHHIVAGTRISPSSAILTSTPSSGGPTESILIAPGGLQAMTGAASVWP
jgi:hypothetical protein